MINITDEKDVQIWCDYQEEARQTSADFFLRLRFANFRIFVVMAGNYNDGFLDYGDGINGNGHGSGWGGGLGRGWGSGYGYGDGNGYGNADNGIGGDGWCYNETS